MRGECSKAGAERGCVEAAVFPTMARRGDGEFAALFAFKKRRRPPSAQHRHRPLLAQHRR